MLDSTWRVLRALHGVREYDPERDGAPEADSSPSGRGEDYARRLAIWRAYCTKQEAELVAEETSGAASVDKLFRSNPLLSYFKEQQKVKQRVYDAKTRHALKVGRK